MLSYITVIPTLFPRQFGSRAARPVTIVDHPNHRSFRYGRDALWAGLELLGLGPGDEILMPATICDVVLLAMIKGGITLKYYGLDATLAPDPAEIESRIGPATRAVYVNHYFGRPTPLQALRQICDKKGLFMIEDCAHALGGQVDEIPLGRTGDIAIFSYRKFLPIPDGGGLMVNTPDVQLPRALHGASAARMLLGTAKLGMLALSEQGLLPLARWKAAWGNPEAYLGIEDALDASDWHPPAAMSAFSRWLISRTDMRIMMEKRRENYRFWMDKLAFVQEATPLFADLKTGHVPFSFPVLVDRRYALVKAAISRGVYLEPTLAPPYRNIANLVNSAESFPEIERIASRVVSLPVHQSLTQAKLDQIWSAVKRGLEVSGKSGLSSDRYR